MVTKIWTDRSGFVYCRYFLRKTQRVDRKMEKVGCKRGLKMWLVVKWGMLRLSLNIRRKKN